MTATMTSQFFTPNTIAANRRNRRQATATWQADIYDFDNEVTSVEVEASTEDEANAMALDAAAAQGIDANYILLYRF